MLARVLVRKLVTTRGDTCGDNRGDERGDNRGEILYLTLAVILVAILLLPSYAGAEDSVATELISFKIKDQFDNLHTDGRYRSSVVLLTWSDRKGSDYSGAWTSALRDSLASDLRSYRLRHIPVAHLKGVPFFIKGKIKGYFSKEPEDWVLMDWGGEFNKAYACSEDNCNVLVFDRNSQLVARWAVSEDDPETLAAMVATLRKLTTR